MWEDDDEAPTDSAPDAHDASEDAIERGEIGTVSRGKHRTAVHNVRGATRRRVPLGQNIEVLLGTVTGLHERRSGSSRYVVAIDGHPVAVVSAELISDLGLKLGRIIDSDCARRLSQGASELAVFDKALDLLAARARSGRELQLRLRRAGATDAMIAPAMEKLRGLGLIDDGAYARSVALTRVLGGGVSRRRIGQELQRRGVESRVADAAIAETLAEVGLDEVGAARAAAEKRLRALRSYDAVTQRKRLYAFLARRGYGPDVIASVLKTVLP